MSLVRSANVRRIVADLAGGNNESALIHGIRPDRSVFTYDNETGIEILFALVDDETAIAVMVSADLAYTGSDEFLLEALNGQVIGDRWKVLCSVPTATPLEALSAVDSLFGLDEETEARASDDEGSPGEREIVAPNDEDPGEEANRFGEDLVAMARRGKLGEVVGRAKEVDALIRILCKSGKNAACLVGEAGVGKTAVVEKLALKVARDEVPDGLRGVRILVVNLGDFTAGASYANEAEGRFKQLLTEARDDPKTILFFDEVHQLCKRTADVSQMAKADLGRGRIRCLGATTNQEWRIIEKDSALARRFQVVPVAEPSPSDTVEILSAVGEQIAEHHGVSLDEEILEQVVDLTLEYDTARRLPDKAIDLLDESASFQVLNSAPHESVRHEPKPLRLDSVHAVVSAWTDIPVPHLEKGLALSQSLDALPDQLKEQVYGQDDAIDALTSALRRSLSVNRRSRKGRPRAVLLFVGPSGVGKTQLAEGVAERFYGDSKRFLKRFDMSEFSSAHTESRLNGAPPGYVGYDRGGQLIQAAKEKQGVLLFDELEKCHPQVRENVLLPIIGEGILHDMSTGALVDIRNFTIIMTSNLGTNDQASTERVGFTSTAGTAADRAVAAVHVALPKEFVGRIDQIVAFAPLDHTAAEGIWARELATLEQDMSEQYGGVCIDVADAVTTSLLEQAWRDVPRHGARAVMRVFERRVADKCLRIMTDTDNDSGPWIISLAADEDGGIRFRRVRPGLEVGAEEGDDSSLE